MTSISALMVLDLLCEDRFEPQAIGGLGQGVDGDGAGEHHEDEDQEKLDGDQRPAIPAAIASSELNDVSNISQLDAIRAPGPNLALQA